MRWHCIQIPSPAASLEKESMDDDLPVRDARVINELLDLKGLKQAASSCNKISSKKKRLESRKENI